MRGPSPLSLNSISVILRPRAEPIVACAPSCAIALTRL